MSETFECPKCGYQWQQGQHGGHSCSDRLLQQLKDVMTERNSILADWNAIVSASGSKTHGGAVGHVAQMRAELEAVKSELITLKRYLAQRKQEFDWAIYANAELVALKTERDALNKSLEIERIRLAACGVVAMSDTPESLEKSLDMHDDYKSASCSDVERRVRECIELRARIEAAENQEPYGYDSCGDLIYRKEDGLKSPNPIALYSFPPMHDKQPASKDLIRVVFLRNGFTIKEGCDDLKDYVFNAAFELLSLALPPMPVQQDVLDKPAQVGSGIFHAGVKTRLVVEAAQRLYENNSCNGD